MLTSPLVRRRRRARSSGAPWRGALGQGLLAVLGLAAGLATMAGALLFSDVTRGLPAVEGYEERFGSPGSPRLPGSRRSIRCHCASESSYRFTIAGAPGRKTWNPMNHIFRTMGILNVDWT